MPYT
jgi:urea transporter